jgi:abequosyltransferase
MAFQSTEPNAKPLLTIAIPTFNRASCLRQLLAMLADQVQAEPRVELIVSDNASPDDTPAVVQDFVSKGLPVRYLRNRENIGPDANFLQCFEQAQGKYVWLFSDDDLLIPGGLAKIVGYLERDEYDMAWVSNYPFASETHTPRSIRSGSEPLEVLNAKDYVKRVHIFFTFITGNIINKDRVLAAGPKPFAELVGTGLIQLSWAYTALNGFVRGLYIREKLVAVRENNTGGYKLMQVFGSTLAKITNEWLESPSLRQIVMNGTVQRFWPVMLLVYKKYAGAFTAEAEPREVLTPIFGDNFRYWLFAYPVIVLPSSIAAAWVFAARALNRLDKGVGYPMLTWRVPAHQGQG